MLEPDFWLNRNRYKANLRTKKVKEIPVATDGGQPDFTTTTDTKPINRRDKRIAGARKAIANERRKR